MFNFAVFQIMSKLCKFYLQGNCKNGRDCAFFHQEIRRDRFGMLSKTIPTDSGKDKNQVNYGSRNNRCFLINCELSEV